MMHPGPMQKPRPPFNLAGHHPRTLNIAATSGDAWNSFYPVEDLTPQQASQVTKERNDLLDQLVADVGRDPAKISGTFFVGYSSDRPFDSEEALDDFIGRDQEADIDEFIFGYIPGFGGEEYYPAWIIDEERLDYVASKLLPS